MLLAPEAELVLRSARVTADPEWRLVCPRPLRWGEVLAAAADERATSVVSHKLPHHTPSEARSAFRKMSLVAEFRHAQLNQLMRTTLETLGRHGTEAVLLKGGALVASGIATTSERPMSDIDLLVARDQAEAEWKRFQDAGWRWDHGRFPAHLYERQHHLPPLTDASGSSYRLEIHRGLFPPNAPFALTPEDVWRRSVRVQWGDHRIRVPDLSHLLVQAAVHFAWSHALESKAWRTFRDVELLVARTQVDWTAVVDAAHRARAGSCVYWTLRLARAVIGTPIPSDVLQQLRPRRSERLLKPLERHYARNMLLVTGRCPSPGLNRVLWEAGIRPQQEGHGSVRPWHGTFRIPEVAEWERTRGRPGFLDRVRQTHVLARYIWGLR